MAKAWDVLEERTGLLGLWRRFADHPLPRGPSVRGVLPAVLVYLFIQQVLIGILLSMHYAPSASDAWASTVYINDQLAGGWFLRGLHYHGTTAMVLATVAYLVQLALTSEYKRPREGVWLAALLLLLVTMVLGVTGNVLPWDEQGYWAIQVELGIVEQSPGGGMLRTVIQGGKDPGNLLLTRMFTVHALLLPAVGILLLTGLIWMGRRADADEAVRQPDPPRQAFFPAQAFLDVLAMGMVAAALVVVTIKTSGSELFAPADPTSAFQARPEWYFLPLFKLRMFFEGPLEPVATMVIPAAVGGFLVIAPVVDARLGRKVTLLGLALVLGGAVGLLGLAIRDDANNEDLEKAMKVAYEDGERARELAAEGVPPRGGMAVWENDPAFKAKALFKEHCGNCHKIDGRGGDEAPELTDYNSRAWLTALIRDIHDPRFFGGTKHDTMDPYPESELPAQALDKIVTYLLAESGMDVPEAEAAEGKALFVDEYDCNGCHEVDPGAEGDGPTMAGRGTSAWVQRVIVEPAAADLYADYSEMPKFGEKLTQEEIEMLAGYVIAQRDAPAE